jgi:glycosyltransferase involved in cell wall biosynthesis
MVNQKTSLLLPSAYRGRQLVNAVGFVLDTTAGHNVELIVGLVEDDPVMKLIERLPAIIDIRTRDEYARGAVYAWNRLAAIATGDVLALWADDLIPQTGWLERSLVHLNRLGDGLIGFNDLSSDGNIYAGHWLASRRFLIEHLGGVMYPPQYRSWWADREVTERAQVLGRYVWARDAVVEHLNYTFGKSHMDDTYRNATANYAADEAVYRYRQSVGYQNDYAPVITALEYAL